MIPFQIPDHLLARLATGEVVRIGAMLRDAGAGRILAHVQETGLLQGLVGVAPPAGHLLSGCGAGANVGTQICHWS